MRRFSKFEPTQDAFEMYGRWDILATKSVFARSKICKFKFTQMADAELSLSLKSLSQQNKSSPALFGRTESVTCNKPTQIENFD